jgi:hypothetical protein
MYILYHHATNVIRPLAVFEILDQSLCLPRDKAWLTDSCGCWGQY